MTEREAIGLLHAYDQVIENYDGCTEYSLAVEVLKTAVMELELYRMNDNSKTIPGVNPGSSDQRAGIN